MNRARSLSHSFANGGSYLDIRPTFRGSMLKSLPRLAVAPSCKPTLHSLAIQIKFHIDIRARYHNRASRLYIYISFRSCEDILNIFALFVTQSFY